MMAKESDDYSAKVSLFDGKFLGRWFPKGLAAKRMVF